jgi:hypothetical protein
MPNSIKRLLLSPLRLAWRLTDSIRDRAIRRLDQRLDLALRAHIEPLSRQLAEHMAQLSAKIDLNAIEATAQQRHDQHLHVQRELQSTQRSIEFCLESVIRELSRFHQRLDELSNVPDNEALNAESEPVYRARASEEGVSALLSVATRRAA